MSEPSLDENRGSMNPSTPTPTRHSPLLQPSVQWTLAVVLTLCFVTLGGRIASRSGTPQSEPIRDADAKLLCLDLNAAAEHELSLLPTVGPVLANRIVQDRQQRGRFQSLDDLRRVPGIGPKTIAEIADYCCVEVAFPQHAIAPPQDAIATNQP
ncbi:helix-hairpin-helix domain-containing protein [Novipirellula rosea]|uniref:Helix-hairpin-helix DNA-binding motif class 1 domain-containing protein n=1 Tax=Novipirellula rosea TaxID=1031540 RepID=A0ABP8MY83_9BACT|tara:strand:- start:555 stop:1016 length:462 start_codon:yes stop_codon:yes gene_type:complete